MASSFTMCASCLRAASRDVNKSAFKTANTAYSTSRTYSRATSAATWQPLHLDFLAPVTLRGHQRTVSAFKTRTSLLTQAQNTSRRTLATTSDPSSAKPAHAIQNPRTDDSGNPMLISISPRASNRLHTIATKDSNPNLALRVSIESGGCHGFQYLMDLTDLSKAPATEEDTIFEGEKGEKVIIDEPSLELLNGSTVDYTMELIGSQFKVTGIPGATSSCGCGTSFDIKL
ncbi:Nn.00g087150.m01.CDS01 [Neocucurbitaria sp. VM-36]